MKKKNYLLCGLISILVGCGGSDSSTPPPVVTPPVTGPTIDPPATSIGFIESVSPEGDTATVNGRQFSVRGVTYSDRMLPKDELEVGMEVETSGDSGQGFDFKLKPTFTGVIGDINRVTGSFTVNGISLTFANLAANINNGDWVMVFTTVAPDGSYKVISVIKTNTQDFLDMAEIEGKITGLNEQAYTFSIKGVTVSYANAQYAFTLQEGQWVEVEGVMVGNQFIAQKIELDSYDMFDGFVGNYEIEGIISWVAVDKSAFELNHRGRFNVLSNTYFEGGNKSMLTPGRQVEITAYSQGNKFYARKVEFENDFDFDFDLGGMFEFECSGQATNYTGSSFEMRCGFPATQRTIYIDYQTHFDEMLPSQIPFTLIDVEGVIINQRYMAREIEPFDFD